MDTKEQLIALIKRWIECDNKIAAAQKLVKEEKQNKKVLTDELLEVMKSHEIDCFDVKNGKLVYTKTKTKQAVSKKVLFAALNNYFNDNPEKASEVTNYILD